MRIFNFLRNRQKDPEKYLREILKEYELPSFPNSVMSVINKLRDPEAPMSEISTLIKSDPGMHVIVLKTVNSAAFGLSRKVSNIQQATTLMGRSRLETLLLPLGVRNAIPQVQNSCIDMKSFWLTSARRACLADQVASVINPSSKMEAFTAGLLQDMAIPVLIDAVKKDYCQTLEKWHNDMDTQLPDLEQKMHGYDHQTVGGLMAREWNLPEYLVDAISAHHYADAKQVEPAVFIVAHLRYKDTDGEPIDQLASRFIHDTLGLEEKMVNNMVRIAFDNAKEFAAIML